MLKTFIFIMLATTFQPACRTTNNKSETWSSQENRDATVGYIKKTVVDLFPGVDASNPELDKFAVALQDQASKQIESAEFLLRGYEDQRKSDPENTNTDVAGYIAEHFLAMTNYIAIHKKVETELKYIGMNNVDPS